jgi:hypothetical protein
MAAKKSTRPPRRRSSIKKRIREHLEHQRRKLLGADAVVICVQRALDSRQSPPDEIRIGDALQVASEIINNAVAALEMRGVS